MNEILEAWYKDRAWVRESKYRQSCVLTYVAYEVSARLLDMGQPHAQWASKSTQTRRWCFISFPLISFCQGCRLSTVRPSDRSGIVIVLHRLGLAIVRTLNAFCLSAYLYVMHHLPARWLLASTCVWFFRSRQVSLLSRPSHDTCAKSEGKSITVDLQLVSLPWDAYVRGTLVQSKLFKPQQPRGSSTVLEVWCHRALLVYCDVVRYR